MKGDNEDWTSVRTSELTRLRRSGKNAAEIARALGGTDRRAVARKLALLGLTDRKGASLSETSPDRGVRTKTLAIDVSPPEILKPRRFSWEQGA